MNIPDLRIFFQENGIKPGLVTILTAGTPMAESYCLSFERGMFEVYYFERGEKLGLCRFLEEDDACECLVSMLRNDGALFRS